MSPRLRCTIYSRKLTEQGLEQGFNSRHAQREACAASVRALSGAIKKGLSITVVSEKIDGGRRYPISPEAKA